MQEVLLTYVCMRVYVTYVCALERRVLRYLRFYCNRIIFSMFPQQWHDDAVRRGAVEKHLLNRPAADW